jgi:hypothetical protein
MDWPAVIAAFRAHALPDRDADDHLAHQRDAREGALRPYNVRALRASAPGDKAQLRADEAPRGAGDQREGVLIAPQDLIRKAS